MAAGRRLCAGPQPHHVPDLGTSPVRIAIAADSATSRQLPDQSHYCMQGTLRWGFVGACVLMEGVKSATSAAASFSNRIFRAWPFNGRGTNHIDAAMLELITQEVFLPAAGHIQGLVWPNLLLVHC